MSEQKSGQSLSRRGFLKYLGGAIAVAAVTSACGQTAAPAAPTTAPAAPAAAATTAPAAASKPFAGKELNLYVGNHWDANVRDLWVPLFQDKTGAKVNYTSIGSGDADAKYAVFAASQDSSQDIFYAWETLVAKYARTLFEDLTPSFKKDVLAGVNDVPVKSMTFLGKLYTIPFDSNMAIFMWNTDLYKAAGLPDKAPESWTEFADFSKKLATGGNFATLFTLGDANSSFFTFLTLFNSTGAEVISQDLKKIQVDTPEGLLAMQAFYDGVVKDKYIDPAGLTINSSIEQGKVFRGGKIGHYFAFPNHYTLAQDPTQSQVVGKCKTGIIPGLKLRSGSGNGFEGCAINKYSKNKELAMAWLEHTVSPEVQKLVGTKWGRPPSLKSAFSDPDVQKAAPQFAAVAEQVKYPARRYGSPFYVDVGQVFNDEMNKMLKGGPSPKDTAANVQKLAQKIIDDYWAKAGG
ncbi:MAG: extracellular solute-binding protein [Chloroflexi bacterium]|nr:extracellular solute-binding protein [Chloroflexota bacterium]